MLRKLGTEPLNRPSTVWEIEASDDDADRVTCADSSYPFFQGLCCIASAAVLKKHGARHSEFDDFVRDVYVEYLEVLTNPASSLKFPLSPKPWRGAGARARFVAQHVYSKTHIGVGSVLLAAASELRTMSKRLAHLRASGKDGVTIGIAVETDRFNRVVDHLLGLADRAGVIVLLEGDDLVLANAIVARVNDMTNAELGF